MNTRIQKWFSQGHVAEALRGEREFHVPDPTFRDEHDVLLVLRVLISWGIAGHMDAAVGGFRACLADYIKSGDLLHALDLVRCYDILMTAESLSLQLDWEAVVHEVAVGIRDMAAELAADRDLRASAIRFIDEHPSAKEVVGLA